MSGKPQGKAGVKNRFDVQQTQTVAKILITVPYLINTVHVARGTALKAAKSNAIIDNRTRAPGVSRNGLPTHALDLD